jgi:DNA (cytosine-5)-methyltransferase 1
MTHGSLFSGIGGFDLASEWMGWENKFHCEWNPFGQKVLKHYWPKAISYEDITKTNFTIHRGNIDILTGGFPCQPYSAAGKRLGKEDERHLWPHMLRAISEIQPTWVVGENVRGLVNWNDGLVFHEVQSDLEAQGYEVQPFLIPAAGINAPHQRYRIWFIAYNDAYSNSIRYEHNSISREYSKTRENGNERFKELCKIENVTNTNSNGLHQCDSKHEIITGQRGINAFSHINESICNGDVTNTSSKGCEWSSKCRETNHKKWEDSKLWETTSKHSPGSWWETFPTESPVCTGDDGISNGLDGITFSKWRKESIKAGGNAIVPQVALNIFKAINEYERINCI